MIREDYVERVAAQCRLPADTVARVLDATLLLISVDALKGKSPVCPYGTVTEISPVEMRIEMSSEVRNLMIGDAPEMEGKLIAEMLRRN